MTSERPSLCEVTPRHDDARVCRRCLRGWGSTIVVPPDGYFRLRNGKTGKYHGVGYRGTSTACGQRLTEDFTDVLA